MRTEQPVQGDADIAPIGALIGDPTRARILTALTDGRALPASRLAAEAGVAPSTVSEHLARLLSGGDGRHHPERAVADRLSAPGRDLSYRLTPRGEAALGEIGVDLDAVLARHPAVRYCLDWSNQALSDNCPRGA